MTFQIVSDLHLEAPAAYDLFEIPARAPFLALLGDIGNVKDAGLFSFLETQLGVFQVVFFLLGNHEPYHTNWTSAKERIHAFSQRVADRPGLGTFVFLDNSRFDVSDQVTVLGCTLFSRILREQENRVSFGVNDFIHMDDWTVEQHSEKHAADLAWLNSQIAQIAAAEPTRQIVVFTHHSPTFLPEAIAPAHANSPISSAFASDLSAEPCWTSPQVKLWAFGHTHHNCRFQSGQKTLLTNQRGYYFAQAAGFDPAFTITIAE
ncbi:hypothetical protein ASPZODRAFT_76546 [Penicilliopsis zonata CBS 506.65]|uniref:Calcineurin-like phosphoesterase domain-containing protein n=1 Tax=Penicilliopsis zonata CBS 506.65 TaxID=1073090 RepID=A0A1L9S614_9EURO|nr:hypothetical protein ASPZODRAFT_76546 [Penicilliopsis zonata CBS 506.65]OJJ42609.1 hypothetical protein ASPZODRAFT_76546 [Penicilliopsis zonata CBS 506.65]